MAKDLNTLIAEVIFGIAEEAIEEYGMNSIGANIQNILEGVSNIFINNDIGKQTPESKQLALSVAVMLVYILGDQRDLNDIVSDFKITKRW